MKRRNDLSFYDNSAAEWWDQNAKIYALNYLNQPRFEYFDRHISDWQGLNVLDVGCGGGYTCEFLAKRGAIVTGVDQSLDCIHAAKEHALEHELAITYYNATAEALPLPDATFDVVVCVDVLEHIADLNQTLSEIGRVLKPGGIFCFDTINRTFRSKVIMIWLLENMLGEIQPGIHDWQKFITPAELSDSLQNLNFGAIEIKGFNLFGTSLVDYWQIYQYYRKTKQFKIYINEDTSVIYIGKAVKAQPIR